MSQIHANDDSQKSCCNVKSVFIALSCVLLTVPRQILTLSNPLKFGFSSHYDTPSCILYFTSLFFMILLAIYSCILMLGKRTAVHFSGLHVSENNLFLFVQLIVMAAVEITQMEAEVWDSLIYSTTFFADLCQVLIFHLHLILVSDITDLCFPHGCVCIFSMIFSLSYGIVDYLVNFFDELPQHYAADQFWAGILAIAFASCVHYRLRMAYYNLRKLVKSGDSIFFYSYASIESLCAENLTMHSIWSMTFFQIKRSFMRLSTNSSSLRRRTSFRMSDNNWHGNTTNSKLMYDSPRSPDFSPNVYS